MNTTYRTHRRWKRLLVVAAVATLLTRQTCIDLFTRSAINGFFQAANPVLAERAAERFTEALEDVELPERSP